jgi:hypothetical protein
MVDPGEISNEINQIFGAGFGGAEIEDVHPSITVPVDPDGHGWATHPWITAVNTASQQQNHFGSKLILGWGRRTLHLFQLFGRMMMEPQKR